MARAKTQLERQAFVRGLITEASPLVFPENASLDELNFVLNRDGSRQRRLGMDFERDNVLIDLATAPSVFDRWAIKSFKWDNVGNNPDSSFGVIQVGNKLWFVDLFSTTLSSNLLNNSLPVNINTDLIGYNISGNLAFDFASINGNLVIASEELDTPFLIKYNEDNDTFNFKEINISVRDIWGIDDGLAVDERPITLSNSHSYNLRNQGWPYSRITNVSGFPSNADVVWFGKKEDGGFDRALINGAFTGTSPAAKGTFIISAFNRGGDRRAKSGVSGLKDDIELGRITCLSSFAGRIFYSGVNSQISDPDPLSPNYAGTIFFTQILENDSQYEKCYQEADPTSEEISDLVATDGGTIKIPEAGEIIKLITTGASLVVIADNGVWEITGPDSVFKATEYSIRRITDIGCIGKDTVVYAENMIMYWSAAGIYMLQPDQVSGQLSASNLSEQSIQSFFESIPTVGKRWAKSNFDSTGRKISWLYNDKDNYNGNSLRFKYNKELVLDTVLQAFSVYEIKETGTTCCPFVADYIQTQNFLSENLVEPVVHNGDEVVVDGVPVVVTTNVRSRGISRTKYVCIVPSEVGNNYSLTFSQYNNPKFKDWNEIDAAAHLVTGYELFQDTQRSKQVQYLTLHFIRTETGFEDVGGGNLEAVNPSSCLTQIQWDFADSPASGKWGREFEGYRLRRPYFPSGEADKFDYGWKVVTTKSRLRGCGRAISLSIKSKPEHDLYLLGWAMDVDGTTNV